jgi:N-acetylmuramoyl-L-alanine amidase
MHPICDQPLPYVDLLPLRDAAAVTLVVVHCTELPDLATAREYGERIVHASGTGNCGHYYIDRDGRTVRYVHGTRVAHHVRGWNEASIGIELVNRGRYPHWWDSRHQAMTEPYPAAQVDALLSLLRELRHAFPQLQRIAGHESLDTAQITATDDPALTVPRKRDPGPLFPWRDVLAGCELQRIEGPSAAPL